MHENKFMYQTYAGAFVEFVDNVLYRTQIRPHPAHMILTMSSAVKSAGIPFNSLRPSDAYLVQIMACRLIGAKPLSEPMLEYH